MRDSKVFRDKMMFNVLRFTYVDGITDRHLNIKFDEAKTVFNS